jgi:hypothetical protein
LRDDGGRKGIHKYLIVGDECGHKLGAS